MWILRSFTLGPNDVVGECCQQSRIVFDNPIFDSKVRLVYGKFVSNLVLVFRNRILQKVAYQFIEMIDDNK